MLLTATTLRDSLANVERFVANNLAMGVDHLVVVLDAPGEPGQAEVADFLGRHPHATCVLADDSWWRGRRPAGLNVRQRINVNAILSVLRGAEWATWLCHIDGDEVAVVDRERLDALPDSTDAIWLPPLEAVSRYDATELPTAFKSLLDDAQLEDLHRRGVIKRPRNQHYFHGHVLGKSGVRPNSGLGLTLHEAVHEDGTKATRHEDGRFRLLHYDAPSGREFVRKWSAMATGGPASFRPNRQRTADQLRELVAADLVEAEKVRRFEEIYRESTEDDVETLEQLGLLTHLDPSKGTHRPQQLDPAQSGWLDEQLDRLRQVSKRRFEVSRGRRAGGRG